MRTPLCEYYQVLKHLCELRIAFPEPYFPEIRRYFLYALSLLSSPHRGTSRMSWSCFVPHFTQIQLRTLPTSQPCVTLVSPCVVDSHPAPDHAYLVDLYLTELSVTVSIIHTPFCELYTSVSYASPYLR